MRTREASTVSPYLLSRWSEQGIAARGCYDLTQHQDASGKSMEYFDDQTKKKFVPHVIEPSLGVDRLFLAIVSSAYDEDEVSSRSREPCLVGVSARSPGNC